MLARCENKGKYLEPTSQEQSLFHISNGAVNFLLILVKIAYLLYNDKMQIDWEEQHDSINRICSLYGRLFSV